jgi:AcrR family transcriptional regulator
VRADAQRNYLRIIEAARDAFREKGYDAPLDEIARRAGVGAGTVYRHFPTKDALYDTIMDTWIDKVGAATERVVSLDASPRTVLLRWLETYVDLISTYKGGPAKVTVAMGDDDSPLLTKCQILVGANQHVIDRLGAALRPGADPLRVARLAGAVAVVADLSDLDSSTTTALLEVVADGLLA